MGGTKSNRERMQPLESESNKPTYRWPRYLLAAVILGIVLAVFAVIKEARRVSQMERVPVYRDPSGANTP